MRKYSNVLGPAHPDWLYLNEYANMYDGDIGDFDEESEGKAI